MKNSSLNGKGFRFTKALSVAALAGLAFTFGVNSANAEGFSDNTINYTGTAEYRGGIIYQYPASNRTLNYGDVDSDIARNTITSSSSGISGGLIYNNAINKNSRANIGNIAGGILNNEITTNSAVYGALIYNSSSVNDHSIVSIGDIYGGISGNIVSANSVYGGLIENVRMQNHSEPTSPSVSSIGNISNGINNNLISSNTSITGGLIVNGSIIGNISGGISNNEVNAGSFVNGSLIYNYGTIGNISGGITGNVATSTNSYTNLIYNGKLIESISDGIKNNEVTANAGIFGGMIFNVESKSTIGDITGGLENNIVRSTSNYISGGLVANYGTIGDIANGISNNEIAAGTYINGALINNSGVNAVIGDITGGVKENIVKSTSNSINGGLIYNYNNATIGDISGGFNGNEVEAYRWIQGGLIRNWGAIGNITDGIKNNKIKSNLNGVQGGLVANHGTIGNITGGISNNEVTGSDIHGGLIDASEKYGNITGGIYNNQVSATAESIDGGLIYTLSQISSVEGGIYHNTVTASGDIKGGVADISWGNIGGNLSIYNNTVTAGNYINGGILYTFDAGELNNFLITRNILSAGGVGNGWILNNTGSTVLNNPVISENTFDGTEGYIIYNNLSNDINSALNINSDSGDFALVANNTSNGAGAAIYNYGESIYDSYISDSKQFSSEQELFDRYDISSWDEYVNVINQNSINRFLEKCKIFVDYDELAARYGYDSIEDMMNDMPGSSNPGGSALDPGIIEHPIGFEDDVVAIGTNNTDMETAPSTGVGMGLGENFEYAVATTGEKSGTGKTAKNGKQAGTAGEYKVEGETRTGAEIAPGSEGESAGGLNDKIIDKEPIGGDDNNTNPTTPEELIEMLGLTQYSSYDEYAQEQGYESFEEMMAANGIYLYSTTEEALTAMGYNKSAIINLSGDVVLTNNVHNGEYNDIYNDGIINLKENAKLTTTGTVSGDKGSGQMNLESDSVWTSANDIQGQALTLNNGTLNLVPFTQADGTTTYGTMNLNGLTVTSAGGTINAINNHVYAHQLGAVTLNGDLNYTADVDLANARMDSLTATSFEGAGRVKVNGLNILSDTDRMKTEVYFTNLLKNNVENNVSEVGKDVPNTYQTTAYSPIYKYNVGYENRNDAGYFVFSRGTDSDAFNPAVLVSPVTMQAAAQSTLNQTFNYVFEHADTFTAMPNIERMARINSNSVALSTDYNQNLGAIDLDHANKGVWVRPYSAFENLPLKHGPKVDVISYGTFVGFDSEIHRLKHGWANVGTAYLGYNGSQMKYGKVDSTMNGGLLGLTETFYKGNFFTALTATAGAGVTDTDTMYGHEDGTFLMGGIGSKTGYNFEFKGGKFIIQPIMFMSYSIVKGFDYTNAAGVRINSEPSHTVQLNPSVRFIGNIEGWQPYASVGMVWDILHESNTKANGVKLPEMYTKPYVQYGLGLQRCWDDKFSAFGQAMIRNGGRNGISLTFGFRWALGKGSETVKTVTPKTVKAKTNKTIKATKTTTQGKKVLKQLSPNKRAKLQNTTRTSMNAVIK